MSAVTLLRHLWRRHGATLLLLAAGAAFFQWAITRVVPAASQTGFMRQLFDMAPAPVRVLLGEELVANLSARGFLGFGYVHPFRADPPRASGRCAWRRAPWRGRSAAARWT